MPLEFKEIRKKSDDGESDGIFLKVLGTGTIKLNDIENFKVFLNNYLDGDDTFKVLYDLRDTSPEMNIIKTLANYMSEIEDKAVTKIQASAIIVSGRIVKGILNMIFKIKPPKTPMDIFYEKSDACDFLNKY